MTANVQIKIAGKGMLEIQADRKNINVIMKKLAKNPQIFGKGTEYVVRPLWVSYLPGSQKGTLQIAVEKKTYIAGFTKEKCQSFQDKELLGAVVEGYYTMMGKAGRAGKKHIHKVVEFLLKPGSFEAAAKVCLSAHHAITSKRDGEKIMYQNTLRFEIEKIEASISKAESGFRKEQLLK